MFNILSTILLCFVLATGNAKAQNNHEQNIKTISGTWLTDDKDGVVELYPCQQKICGRFHWLKEDSPENPSLDDKNRDPDKRNVPLCGLQFMGGFEPQGGGRFTDGWIYSPHDGNTYSANLTLRDQNTLELHGYVLIPLFGQSRFWTRTGTEPTCQTAKLVKP
jgi:uncharacterized protein (DUF2147 family)